jgi:hypothetical protein
LNAGKGGTIVIICVQLELFPALSVIIKVLVIVPPHSSPIRVPSLHDANAVNGQLSLTVALAPSHGGIAALHSTIMLDGHMITGASVSLIVTVKEHIAIFPEASVPVQFTVVDPTGKKLPEEGEQVLPGLGSQLSEIPTINVTVAPHNPSSFG